MATEVDSATAIRRVNDTLRGPVTDVFADLMPEVKGLPRDQVYDRALDDLGLLKRCLDVFRRERKHFRFIVVDARYQPVTDDDTQLSCGRTLREVIAMVIRTAAKRYFRRKLSGAREQMSLTKRLPVLKRTGGSTGEKQHGAADDLYDAINTYLLHEWQVPLVPTYADMTPGLVRTLGPRLLDIREEKELRRLVDDPAAAAQLARQPRAEPTAEAAAAESAARGSSASADLGDEDDAEPIDLIEDFLTADGMALKAEAFTAILLRPDVRAEMPSGVLRLSDTLRGVGSTAVRQVMGDLQFSAAQLAVFLIHAHEEVGEDVFYRIFGQPGQPQLIARVVKYAQAAKIGPQTPLHDCATFVRKLLAQAAAASSPQK